MLLARAVGLATRTARGKRLLWRTWYQFLAARYRDPRWTFMNYGYRPQEGEDALRQVTDVLKAIPNRNFQVAGHTDNIPIKSKRFRSNWDLSTARAVEVVNFMISSGMEPKRLSAAGYADQSPVATNDSSENKAKNRRIEITLVPNLDDLPPIDDALKDAPAASTPAATPDKS